MRGLTRAVLLALGVAACAKIAPPPGGPLRTTPPVLVSMFPDSAPVPADFHGDAEFRFDEVLLESQPSFGYGTGDLERLILFSPDTSVPVIRWHRDRFTVRPRGGWRPNTVYRIELAPGVADLQRNISKSSAVISFATGGTLPNRALSGRVIDWTASRAAGGALVEAFHLPDSLRYRTVTDSTGRFRFEHLPAGPYLVVATIDQNRDHRRQPGEAWDSVRVNAPVDTVGEIWTFPRDTLPPKIQDATRQDSQTVAVTFTRPIDPLQRLDTLSIRVLLLPDSVGLGTVTGLPRALFDSLLKPAPKVRTPKEDSLFRVDSLRRDSLARMAPTPTRGARGTVHPPAFEDGPRQKRPVLGSVILIRTRGFLQPGKTYYVELRHVRTAGGISGPPVFRTFTVPKAAVIDSAKARAECVRADSLRRLNPAAPVSHADSLAAAACAKASPGVGRAGQP